MHDTAEIVGAPGRGHTPCSILNNTELLSSGNEELDSTSTLHPSTQGFAEAPLRPVESSHSSSQSQFAGMPFFGQAVSSQHVSPRVADIIAASWRDSTKKQYKVNLEKWQTYCGGRGINPISASRAKGLDFLAELDETGRGYSVINTAGSALSTVIGLQGSIRFGVIIWCRDS